MRVSAPRRRPARRWRPSCGQATPPPPPPPRSATEG
ncbi:hypothetical protein ACP4OV_027122 [Aristida adscensionis]